MMDILNISAWVPGPLERVAIVVGVLAVIGGMVVVVIKSRR